MLTRPPRERIAPETLVVLDVARTLHRAGVDVALELLEQLAVALAHDVDEHVEAAPVGHADDGLAGARQSAASSSRASSRGMADSAPSRPKRFWPMYLVSRNCSSASAAFSRSRIWRCSSGLELGRRPLDVLLDPPLLRRLLDVHVLDADRPAVGVPEQREDVAEPHPLPVPPGLARGTPGRGPRRSARRWRVELGVHVGLGPVERVQVGDQVAPHPVGIDEPVDLFLFLDVNCRTGSKGSLTSRWYRTGS